MDQQAFELWLHRANQRLLCKIGMDSGCLPDWPNYDCHAAGFSPCIQNAKECYYPC